MSLFFYDDFVATSQADAAGGADPMCIVRRRGHEVGRTTTIYGSLDPVWGGGNKDMEGEVRYKRSYGAIAVSDCVFSPLYDGCLRHRSLEARPQAPKLRATPCSMGCSTLSDSRWR